MPENIKKSGYCITTYKVRLYTNYEQYIKLSTEVYNELVLRYYNLLFKYEEFVNLPSRECAKQLEKITIISKTGEKGKEYFESNAPRSIRRAAITCAVKEVKTYFSKLQNSKYNPNIGTPSKTKKFNYPMTYFNDMYKDIREDGKFKIKLFSGQEWKWYDAKFKDWNKLSELETLSPTIVLKKDYVMAHIPVKQIVDDVTPIKDRLKNKDVRVCGVAFSNSDNFAICTVVDNNGKLIKTLFVSGGNEYRHRTKIILDKIFSDKCKVKHLSMVKGDHKNYWKKLHNISEYYAHDVSKKIVEFCVENKVQIIAIANLTGNRNYFEKKIKKYTPIFLRRKITNYLKYKAFKESILVKAMPSNFTATKCYKCGGTVKRNRNELKVTCENGHMLDYFFNSAMNISLACLEI